MSDSQSAARAGSRDRLALVVEWLAKDGAVVKIRHDDPISLDKVVAAYCSLHPETPVPQTADEKRKLITGYLLEVSSRVSGRGRPFKLYKPSIAMEAAVARCREPIQLEERYDDPPSKDDEGSVC